MRDWGCGKTSATAGAVYTENRGKDLGACRSRLGRREHGHKALNSPRQTGRSQAVKEKMNERQGLAGKNPGLLGQIYTDRHMPHHASLCIPFSSTSSSHSHTQLSTPPPPTPPHSVSHPPHPTLKCILLPQSLLNLALFLSFSSPCFLGYLVFYSTQFLVSFLLILVVHCSSPYIYFNIFVTRGFSSLHTN